jgi:hypothetical protein
MPQRRRRVLTQRRKGAKPAGLQPQDVAAYVAPLRLCVNIFFGFTSDTAPLATASTPRHHTYSISSTPLQSNSVLFGSHVVLLR